MTNHTDAAPDTEPGKKWLPGAACRTEGVDPDAMFPDNSTAGTAIAKSICRPCPVWRECLRDALRTGDNQHGIRGGLKPEERRAVAKELRRREEAKQQPNNQNATPAAPRKSYTTLRALLDDNTKRLIHGHLAWTGPAKPHFKGQPYNPKQVAFILGRGRAPVGRVLTTCSLAGCVLPAHIADDEERMRCGTRQGYQRHLREKTDICPPCRQANTDADNRLRRTGTTRATA
jgi:transcription factor WhiB